jgi:membrane peptidoglycan carboxypeptidase
VSAKNQKTSGDLAVLDGWLRPCRGPGYRADTPRRKARNIAAYLAIPVMIGLLAGVWGIGPARASSDAVSAAQSTWDAIPVDQSVLTHPLDGHTIVLGADGNQIADFYTEDRIPVGSLEDVSPHLVSAVLSVEDRRFYEESAFDPKGLARAAATGSGGGSGITQQYAKLLRVNAAVTDEDKDAATAATVSRKLIELKYAVALHNSMSKDDILLGYLNTAYFGNGAYGVGAAARRYFGVDPKDLDIAQSAMLAGLLQSPDGYDPTQHPEAALDRRNTALSMMLDNEAITRAEYESARNEDINARLGELPSGCSASPYPYYCEAVKEELLSDPAFGASEQERAAAFQRGGITVTTALRPDLQNALQANLDTNFSSDHVKAAQSLVEPGTGRVLAMVQTTSYADTQFNLNTDSTVQPGSAFKPITLAAALETGFDIDTALEADSPYVPATGSAPDGGFVNLGGVDYGTITARTATKFSANTWFVRLAEQVGTATIADTAYKLGMSSMDPGTRSVGPGDWSITLGAFETTPLDMANVYATLAASGRACAPTLITKVTTAGGEEQSAPDAACHQAMPAAVADTVTQTLAATQEAGGTAASISVPGQPWVGKTGTTTNFGATWFAGYTRHFASAVWLGDPDSSSNPVANVWSFGQHYGEVYGSDVAGPLWAGAMRAISTGVPAEAFPTPGPIVPELDAMPTTVGMSEAAAKAALQAAGIRSITVVPVDSAMPSGTVVTQTPDRGTTLPTSVTLEVSR